jgi:hypothetical protein
MIQAEFGMVHHSRYSVLVFHEEKMNTTSRITQGGVKTALQIIWSHFKFQKLN